MSKEIPKDNIRDSLCYWLGKRHPFIINGEYEVKLLFIDTKNFSAKIQITNLKTSEVHQMEVPSE